MNVINSGVLLAFLGTQLLIIGPTCILANYQRAELNHHATPKTIIANQTSRNANEPIGTLAESLGLQAEESRHDERNEVRVPAPPPPSVTEAPLSNEAPGSYWSMSRDGSDRYQFGFDTEATNKAELTSIDDDNEKQSRQLSSSAADQKSHNKSKRSKEKKGARLMREESRLADGTVIGRYGYTDPFNVFRIVQYVAGADGYFAAEDVGGLAGDGAHSSGSGSTSLKGPNGQLQLNKQLHKALQQARLARLNQHRSASSHNSKDSKRSNMEKLQKQPSYLGTKTTIANELNAKESIKNLDENEHQDEDQENYNGNENEKEKQKDLLMSGQSQSFSFATRINHLTGSDGISYATAFRPNRVQPQPAVRWEARIDQSLRSRLPAPIYPPLADNAGSQLESSGAPSDPYEQLASVHSPQSATPYPSTPTTLTATPVHQASRPTGRLESSQAWSLLSHNYAQNPAQIQLVDHERSEQTSNSNQQQRASVAQALSSSIQSNLNREAAILKNLQASKSGHSASSFGSRNTLQSEMAHSNPKQNIQFEHQQPPPSPQIITDYSHRLGTALRHFDAPLYSPEVHETSPSTLTQGHAFASTVIHSEVASELQYKPERIIQSQLDYESSSLNHKQHVPHSAPTSTQDFQQQQQQTAPSSDTKSDRLGLVAPSSIESVESSPIVRYATRLSALHQDRRDLDLEMEAETSEQVAAYSAANSTVGAVSRARLPDRSKRLQSIFKARGSAANTNNNSSSHTEAARIRRPMPKGNPNQTNGSLSNTNETLPLDNPPFTNSSTPSQTKETPAPSSTVAPKSQEANSQATQEEAEQLASSKIAAKSNLFRAAFGGRKFGSGKSAVVQQSSSSPFETTIDRGVVTGSVNAAKKRPILRGQSEQSLEKNRSTLNDKPRTGASPDVSSTTPSSSNSLTSVVETNKEPKIQVAPDQGQPRATIVGMGSFELPEGRKQTNLDKALYDKIAQIQREIMSRQSASANSSTTSTSTSTTASTTPSPPAQSSGATSTEPTTTTSTTTQTPTSSEIATFTSEFVTLAPTLDSSPRTTSTTSSTTTSSTTSTTTQPTPITTLKNSGSEREEITLIATSTIGMDEFLQRNIKTTTTTDESNSTMPSNHLAQTERPHIHESEGSLSLPVDSTSKQTHNQNQDQQSTNHNKPFVTGNLLKSESMRLSDLLGEMSNEMESSFDSVRTTPRNEYPAATTTESLIAQRDSDPTSTSTTTRDSTTTSTTTTTTTTNNNDVITTSSSPATTPKTTTVTWPETTPPTTANSVQTHPTSDHLRPIQTTEEPLDAFLLLSESNKTRPMMLISFMDKPTTTKESSATITNEPIAMQAESSVATSATLTLVAKNDNVTSPSSPQNPSLSSSSSSSSTRVEAGSLSSMTTSSHNQTHITPPPTIGRNETSTTTSQPPTSTKIPITTNSSPVKPTTRGRINEASKTSPRFGRLVIKKGDKVVARFNASEPIPDSLIPVHGQSESSGVILPDMPRLGMRIRTNKTGRRIGFDLARRTDGSTKNTTTTSSSTTPAPTTISTSRSIDQQAPNSTNTIELKMNTTNELDPLLPSKATNSSRSLTRGTRSSQESTLHDLNDNNDFEFSLEDLVESSPIQVSNRPSSINRFTSSSSANRQQQRRSQNMKTRTLQATRNWSSRISLTQGAPVPPATTNQSYDPSEDLRLLVEKIVNLEERRPMRSITNHSTQYHSHQQKQIDTQNQTSTKASPQTINSTTESPLSSAVRLNATTVIHSTHQASQTNSHSNEPTNDSSIITRILSNQNEPTQNSSDNNNNSASQLLTFNNKSTTLNSRSSSSAQFTIPLSPEVENRWRQLRAPGPGEIAINKLAAQGEIRLNAQGHIHVRNNQSLTVHVDIKSNQPTHKLNPEKKEESESASRVESTLMKSAPQSQGVRVSGPAKRDVAAANKLMVNNQAVKTQPPNKQHVKPKMVCIEVDGYEPGN